MRLLSSCDRIHLNDRNPPVGVLDFIRFKLLGYRVTAALESAFTPSAFRGISTVNMAKAFETNRRLLMELLERDGNGECVDCGVAGKETALLLFMYIAHSLSPPK